MKKLIVIGIVAVMMMGMAMSANAWIISVKTATSSAGQLSQEISSILNVWGVAGVPETRQGFWIDNTPQVAPPTLFSYKSMAAPAIWWGQMFKGAAGGPDTVKVSFYTPSALKAPTGLWYLYTSATLPVFEIGHSQDAALLAQMTLQNPGGTAITGLAYNTAGTITFDLNAGHYFALTPVPEPGSLLALASGLVGLIGFGIRRRK